MRLKCVIIILSSLAAVRNRNVLLFIADDAGLEVRHYICQAQVQSQIQVPNPGPESMSQIQVLNPKSKVQRKGTGTGADNLILVATTQ